MPTLPLVTFFSSSWKHKNLITQLATREVAARYRGSFGGIFWSFLTPLLMLAVYSFVFSFVFQAKWEVSLVNGQSSTMDFALILFSGLMLHAFFSECLNRAPTLITGNPNFVKKVIFPLEVLPLVAMGSALFHLFISLFVLVLAYIACYHQLPPVTILLAPVVLLPFIMLTAGISWFLASFGVFFRDLNYTIGIMTSILLFLSPIFYPITKLPAAIQPLFYLNPLSFIVEQFRNVVLLGNLPDMVGLGLYTTIAVAICLIGGLWFSKTRKGFADVL